MLSQSGINFITAWVKVKSSQGGNVKFYRWLSQRGNDFIADYESTEKFSRNQIYRTG
jgi:hypothetical protein